MEEPTDLVKILFLILAGGGSEHKHDQAIQREYCMQPNLKYANYLYVTGSPGSSAHILKDQLIVDAEDSDLLKKTIEAVKFSLSHLDFDLIIRTNVSTFFDLRRIPGAWIKISETKSFGGFVELCRDTTMQKRNFSFVTGTGIFLSKSAAQILITLPLPLELFEQDDVSISRYLLSRYVNLIPIKRTNLSYHHLPFSSTYVRCKSSFNPMLASKRIIYLSQISRCKFSLQRLKLLFFELNIMNKSWKGFVTFLSRIPVLVRGNLFAIRATFFKL